MKKRLPFGGAIKPNPTFGLMKIKARLIGALREYPDGTVIIDLRKYAERFGIS